MTGPVRTAPQKSCRRCVSTSPAFTDTKTDFHWAHRHFFGCCCYHAWQQNIYIYIYTPPPHPPSPGFNVSAPRAAENKTPHIHSPPKSPPNTDPLRIVCHWRPLSKRVFISLLLLILLLLFARIISHYHLLGISQRVTKPEETLQKQMHAVTAKKRKVLTSVLQEILRYYSSDSRTVSKYSWT